MGASVSSDGTKSHFPKLGDRLMEPICIFNQYLRHFTGAPGKSGFGSSSTAEDVTLGRCLQNYTAIVTGATSGIGIEIARVLAKRGCCVVIPARNLKVAQTVKESILQETPNADVIPLKMDLSSFNSVRSFAQQFLALNRPLNILINNAGVFCQNFRESEDGHEMTFATNHLGHFLLTKLVLERMISSAKDMEVQGRIVNVSSFLHGWTTKQGILFDSLNDPRCHHPRKTYSQTKLANILHAKELKRRLQDMGANVTANAAHPGVINTNLLRESKEVLTGLTVRAMSTFMKTVPQGAATVCYVATHPTLKGTSGKYFIDCNEAECSQPAKDEDLARRLWNYSEKITNLQQHPEK